MKNFNSIAVYMLGYVRIKFWGDYCERFLNVLAANSVVFRNIKKQGEYFYITVLKKDFFKLHKLRKNCGVKIKIIKKAGIPFILNKHKFRYGMVIGFAFFVLMLSFLSTRLWLIEINGNSAVSNAEIIYSINKLGIKTGMSMDKIDTDILKLKFVISGENIAWASFNRQGSVLEVNLSEFDNTKIENTPSNLIAEYDAIIKKVDIQSGTSNVKIGDTVTKGQLLISGVDNYVNGSNFVTPIGKIIAEVRVTENINIPENYKSYEYDGKTVYRYNINIMGVKLPLYLGSLKGDYEKSYNNFQCKLFNGKIPIEITNIICKKTYENTTFLNDTRAKEMAKKQIENKYLLQGCSEIIFTNESVIKVDGEYKYFCSVKFLKDIALREEIFFENE